MSYKGDDNIDSTRYCHEQWKGKYTRRGPDWLWAIINLFARVHDWCGEAKRWVRRRTWCKWFGHLNRHRPGDRHWKNFFMSCYCRRCHAFLAKIDASAVGGGLVRGNLYGYAGARPTMMIIDDLDESPRTPEQEAKMARVFDAYPPQGFVFDIWDNIAPQPTPLAPPGHTGSNCNVCGRAMRSGYESPFGPDTNCGGTCAGCELQGQNVRWRNCNG